MAPPPRDEARLDHAQAQPERDQVQPPQDQVPLPRYVVLSPQNQRSALEKERLLPVEETPQTKTHTSATEDQAVPPALQTTSLRGEPSPMETQGPVPATSLGAPPCGPASPMTPDMEADDQSFASAVLKILGLALAVALCFVLLRAFLRAKRLQRKNIIHSGICNSTSCDRLAAALQYSMMLEQQANPCDDFYQFVCGQYDRLEAPGTTFDWMLAEVHRSVRNQASAVADKIAPPASNYSSYNYSIMQKIQSLYDACMRPIQEKGNAPALRAFVHKQGLGFSADATATDVLGTMLRLSYIYDVQSVLAARLLVSSSEPDQPLLLRTTVNERYLTWVNETRAMSDRFAATSYGALLAVYGDVDNVSRVIVRIRQAETAVLGLVKGLAAEQEHGLVNVIADYEGLRFYGNGSVRTLVSGLRSTLQSGELRLLLSWDVVRTMAPVVSKVSVPADSLTPHRRCWNLIHHTLGGPAFASYLLDHLHPQTTDAAIVMTQELRDTYTALLNNSNFPWSALSPSMVSEFQLLRAAPTFFPAHVQSRTQLDALYGAYPFSRGYPSFFETWLGTCDLAVQTQRNVSQLSLDTLEALNAMYFKGRIVISGPLLLMPLFAFDNLVAANFGGLGHVVAHEMLRRLHHKLTEAGNQSSGPHWAEYENRVRCLQQSRMQGNSSAVTSESGGDVNRTLTLPDVADLVGLHAAYETFGAHREHRGLPSTNMTEEQIFFAVSCFKFCKHSGAADGHQWRGSQFTGPMTPPTPPRERCNEPLRHLQAFADAFHCSNSSRMNAAVKCTFW